MYGSFFWGLFLQIITDFWYILLGSVDLPESVDVRYSLLRLIILMGHSDDVRFDFHTARGNHCHDEEGP